MKREIRWLVTFTHPLFLRQRGHVQDGGSITFKDGSRGYLDVYESKFYMPGFGELKIKEGEHFEFLDTLSDD